MSEVLIFLSGAVVGILVFTLIMAKILVKKFIPVLKEVEKELDETIDLIERLESENRALKIARRFKL